MTTPTDPITKAIFLGIQAWQNGDPREAPEGVDTESWLYGYDQAEANRERDPHGSMGEDKEQDS